MSTPYSNPTPSDDAPISFTTTLSVYSANRRTHIFTNPFLESRSTTSPKLYEPADTTRTREAHVTARVERACIKEFGADVTFEKDVFVWGWVDGEGVVGIEGVEMVVLGV